VPAFAIASINSLKVRHRTAFEGLESGHQLGRLSRRATTNSFAYVNKARAARCVAPHGRSSNAAEPGLFSGRRR
jgi:hypothetical protein